MVDGDMAPMSARASRVDATGLYDVRQSFATTNRSLPLTAAPTSGCARRSCSPTTPRSGRKREAQALHPPELGHTTLETVLRGDVQAAVGEWSESWRPPR